MPEQKKPLGVGRYIECRDVLLFLNNLQPGVRMRFVRGKWQRFVFLFILAQWIVIYPILPSVSETWDDLNALAYQSYVAGEYNDALKACTRALATAKGTFGEQHPNVAESLRLLGKIYVAQGQLGEAQSCFRAALKINDPKQAVTANLLLSLYESKRSGNPIFQVT
jgi:tetratricopeptide (TPR) repeat protein